MSAASEGRENLYARADKSIKTAATPAAVDEILRRVEAKVSSGEMDARAVNDLRKVGEARKAILAKSRPAPQPEAAK